MKPTFRLATRAGDAAGADRAGRGAATRRRAGAAGHDRRHGDGHGAGAADRAGRRGGGGRSGEGVLEEGTADHDAVLPRRRTSAASTCSRRRRIRASSSPASSSTSARLHLAGPEPVAPQHRGAEHRQRRQRQPAGRHRLRVQQLDGEPEPARAARARHPRRADQLPVVAAPQRDLGEGRLHPDRRVADRLRAAEDADARSSRCASATWRSTTATRTSAAATTATRSTTRSSATTSWTPSPPRSAARST